MKYVHPTNKTSGNIVYNNHHVFSVVNGEVEVLADGKPYNILVEHGFTMKVESVPVVSDVVRLAAPTPAVNSND